MFVIVVLTYIFVFAIASSVLTGEIELVKSVLFVSFIFGFN